MNAYEAIMRTNGKVFKCVFEKKDGTLRTLIGRLGVGKHVKGKGLKFKPEEKHLKTVFDFQKKQYRMINLDAVQRVKCGDLLWEATT